MPPRTLCGRAVLTMLSAGLFVASVVPSHASPPVGGVSSSRARVAQSTARLDKAREKAADARTELDKASKRLDAIVLEQAATRSRLGMRVSAMYRTGDMSLISVLLGSNTFEEFATRWHLLTLMNRHDADSLRQLEALRVRARKASATLIRLQEESARAEDKAARELAAARKDLAHDEAALAELDARKPARTEEAAATTALKAPSPGVRRGGPWKTAVASHYGRNFSGRGASGSKIGPYSMMCAHKTLPFGTLVEFEYRGRRALASVQDRGPHTPGRDFDLGPGIVRVLDFEGVQQVRYRIVER